MTTDLFKEAIILGAKDAIDTRHSREQLPFAIRYHAEHFNSQKQKRSEIQDRLLDAHVDSLSGAYTRAYAERYLAKLSNQETGTQDFGLILLDLNRFKSINDQWGHNYGDQVIRETVAKLKSTLRLDTLLFRWGGDEFLITCPNVDMLELTSLGMRIANAITEITLPDGNPLTTSFGAATAKQSPWTPSSLIDEADQALYQIKGTRQTDRYSA